MKESYTTKIKSILKELEEGMKKDDASRHEKRRLHWQHEVVMRLWKELEEVDG